MEADRALHFDVLEAYAWGQEFQLGYSKHGPFWACVAGAWFSVFPANNTSFVALEAANATFGVLGAWLLIGCFAQGWARHAATLLLLATPFYTFQAYKYNANTIFISLWPWTLYFFVKSIDTIKQRDAAFFAIFAAAAMLSKYYAVILLATCAISLLFHPHARRYLLSPLPWIAGAVFLALTSPHLYWVLKNNAPTVAYAMNRTGNGVIASIGSAVRFLLEISLFHLGVVAIIFMASRVPPKKIVEFARALSPSRRRFLATLVLAPPLLTVFLGLAFQVKVETIMAVGAFPLAPLFLMQFVSSLDGRRCFKLAATVAAGVTFLTLCSAPIARAVMAANKNGPSFVFPYRELAASATGVWRSETNAPLRYVGGGNKIANALSFYSRDRPSSFIDMDYGKAPWVTPSMLRQHGLLIACAREDAGCNDRAAAFLSERSKRNTITVERALGTRQMPPITFDIYIIPPLG